MVSHHLQSPHHQCNLIDFGICRIATIFKNCNLPPGQKIFTCQSTLNFVKIHSMYPGRAVFSLDSGSTRGQGRLPGNLTYRRKTFKRLRDAVGPGRLGEADDSVPGSRTRLFESPAGMFVIQVRGSVGDCALPALNIDSAMHEVTFQWRGLFSRFFGGRKVATAVLNDAPVSYQESVGLLLLSDLAASRQNRRRHRHRHRRIRKLVIPLDSNRKCGGKNSQIRSTRACKLLHDLMCIRIIDTCK